MPSNIVDISILSPLHFIKAGYTNPIPYNTKYRENWHYEDTIGYWEEKRDYFQPWEQSDIIPIQIMSNYAPHQLELYDCNGLQVDVFPLAYVASSIDISGQRAYQAIIALNTYDEGVYRFVINSGSPFIDQHISNWFYLKEKHENTVLLETTHDENDFNYVFETGIPVKLRIHGRVGQYQPGSERVVFVDQPNNITLLSGSTFSTGVFIIGDQWGVPDIFIQKINQHFVCSKVFIDGKQFAGNQGARFEAKREDNYPMTGWAFELREADAGTKTRSIADELQGNPFMIVYNIQNKGFGSITNPASTNTIQIENLT